MKALLLSDIHANLVALEAVIADAGPVDAVWSLGDVAGYGPRPNECADWVAAHAGIAVVGNHDSACIGRLDIADFNDAAQVATLWTASQLTAGTRAWLEQLPERHVKGDYTFVHASPRAPTWEYLLDTSSAADNFKHFDTRLCFAGHTHLPMIFTAAPRRHGAVARRPPAGTTFDPRLARCIVNPGSVGQPRDGDPRAAYAIVDAGARTVDFRRCAYDVAETQRQMDDVSLPGGLIERLAYGL